MKDKKYHKVRDHCHYTWEYRGAAHSICNLKYSVPKKNYIVFNNRSNYEYHCIIKELAQEFSYKCLRNYKKKLQELVKTENKLQKIHLTY